MNREAALEIVIRALDTQTHSRVQISEQTRLRTDLGLQSLSALEVIFYLEGELGVRLDDNAIYETVTVGDLAQVSRKQVDIGPLETKTG